MQKIEKEMMYLSIKLTPKQKKFADEYIISGNAYQSAINAGYSDNYAKAQSSKMLENVGIKSYIEERIKKLDEQKIAKQEEVLAFFTATMRAEIKEPMAVSNSMGGDDIKMVIPSAATRKSAADSLAKVYGMFTQKLEIEAETVVIKDDIDE